MKKPGRGRPKRSDEAAAEDRARILAAAEKLFAQGGYDGVSMRNVAKEAGCSPAALYTLFPHKRALLRNIWEEAFAELDVALEAAVRRKRDPMQKLKLLGRAFVDFWCARPDHFLAIFMIQDRVVEPGERYFVETSASLPRLVALFEEAVSEAIAAGRMSGPPRAGVELIFCGLYGVASALISMPEYSWTDPSRMAGRMTDALLRGLTKG
jgi:AcrR family transcriptional regulator